MRRSYGNSRRAEKRSVFRHLAGSVNAGGIDRGGVGCRGADLTRAVLRESRSRKPMPHRHF